MLTKIRLVHTVPTYGAQHRQGFSGRFSEKFSSGMNFFTFHGYDVMSEFVDKTYGKTAKTYYIVGIESHVEITGCISSFWLVDGESETDKVQICLQCNVFIQVIGHYRYHPRPEQEIVFTSFQKKRRFSDEFKFP